MRGPGGPAGLQNRFAALSKAVAVRFPRIPLSERSRCSGSSYRYPGVRARREGTVIDPAVTFYDDLADIYHLIYPDWGREVRRQGEVLDRLIRAQMGSETLSILDCSAGIGTQAIGRPLPPRRRDARVRW